MFLITVEEYQKSNEPEEDQTKYLRFYYRRHWHKKNP